MVGAGLKAGAAAGAGIGVQDDDAARPFGDGLCRADIDAGRFVAVSAHSNPETEFELARHDLGSVLPDADEFDPVGGLVLLLAGHLAGLAAPAKSLPNRQSVGRHCFFSG